MLRFGYSDNIRVQTLSKTGDSIHVDQRMVSVQGDQWSAELTIETPHT